jgi:hypothetical protein
MLALEPLPLEPRLCVSESVADATWGMQARR